MSEATNVEGRVVSGCVQVEIDIAAPPDAVFEFLVDTEKLLRWMGEEADIEPRPGGKFWLKVHDDDVAEGEYVEVTPPERVVLTWGWKGSEAVPPGSSTVVFELEATELGTRVHLAHTELPPEACSDHLEGWRHFGARLSEVGST